MTPIPSVASVSATESVLCTEMVAAAWIEAWISTATLSSFRNVEDIERRSASALAPSASVAAERPSAVTAMSDLNVCSVALSTDDSDSAISASSDRRVAFMASASAFVAIPSWPTMSPTEIWRPRYDSLVTYLFVSPSGRSSVVDPRVRAVRTFPGVAYLFRSPSVQLSLLMPSTAAWHRPAVK